ncbi:aspartate/glutamate racemase family protein [Oscillibacter sp. MSJ-2]|uniref:Aspartate/glutamate racemase family protein n=1 Tax=Dysosmobacter acutus TaxID=2841504 RepID=A0ABS6FCV4_9FIRM|nr:aspartate/glutamate racemase family protein [Dysosmobacter acutus]
MRKRIKIIIPNTTSEFNESVYNLFNPLKASDTELDICNIKGEGALYLDQKYDEVWSELSLLKEAEQAEKDGFDGVIVYCALDPARMALREALQIPVVSIFETALHVTAMLGNHISLIAPPGSIASREEMFHQYHMEDQMTSVEFFNLGIENLAEDESSSYQIVKAAAQRALNKGADSLVLGCGAVMGIAKRLSEELGVPVVEPGPVALKYCEALIELGLHHSKVAFSLPRRHMP